MRPSVISLLSFLLLLAYSTSPNAQVTPKSIAKQKWYIASTPHFEVITDTNEKTAVKLATNLERFRAMAQSFSGASVSSSVRPIKLYAVKRSKTYRLLHGDSKHMRNTQGFFRDSINGNYSALKLASGSFDNNLSILFHEYTHYLSANLTAANSPFWYSEGFAEFLGVTEFKDDVTIHYGKPVLRHLNSMSKMSWMHLRDLLTTTHVNYKERRKRYRIYSQGWLFVHYLNSSVELTRKKRMFFEKLSSGMNVESAVEAAFEMTIDELNLKLKRYLRGPIYYTSITLKSPLKTEDITARRLPPHEALYEVGEFLLQAGRSFKRSRPFFEKALELNPNYPDALAGLANTYLGQDTDKMEEYLSKARELQNNNPWVATIDGHMHLSLMRKAKDNAVKDKLWNKAAKSYNLAINSGEINVEAITSAASMYADRKRWDKYYELSAIAYAIAPSNYNVRTQLIHAAVQNDKLEIAEKVAKQVRLNHHMSAARIERFETWLSDLMGSDPAQKAVDSSK